MKKTVLLFLCFTCLSGLAQNLEEGFRRTFGRTIGANTYIYEVIADSTVSQNSTREIYFTFKSIRPQGGTNIDFQNFTSSSGTISVSSLMEESFDITTGVRIQKGSVSYNENDIPVMHINTSLSVENPAGNYNTITATWRGLFQGTYPNLDVESIVTSLNKPTVLSELGVSEIYETNSFIIDNTAHLEFNASTFVNNITINNPQESVDYYFAGDSNFKVTKSKLNVETLSSEEDMIYLFQIFPNPTSEEIYIKNIDKFFNEYEISIFNTLGEKVLTVKNKSNISLSYLPNGLYILEINTYKGSIKKRVVKR